MLVRNSLFPGKVGGLDVNIEFDSGADYSYLPANMISKMKVNSVVPVKVTQYDESVEHMEVVIVHVKLGDVFEGLVNFMVTKQQTDIVILSNTFMVKQKIVFHMGHAVIRSEKNDGRLTAVNASLFGGISNDIKLASPSGNGRRTISNGLDVRTIYRSPCFEVVLGGKSIRAFLDTGADSSLITKRALEGMSSLGNLPLKPNSSLLFPFYDKEVMIEKNVILRIELGEVFQGPTSFLVVDERFLNETIPDVILSWKFGKENKLIYYAASWSLGSEKGSKVIKAINADNKDI